MKLAHLYESFLTLRALGANLRVMVIISFLTSCHATDDSNNKHVSLTVWAHSGQAAERDTLQRQVANFQHSHPELNIRLNFIPERSYNAQIQAAALAGDLPDILEFDGPYLYNYVWQGHLQPLDRLLDTSVINNLLPSIKTQGMYAGKLYGVGVFDSGLGLYARRSALLRTNARIPTEPDDAWSIEEFNTILSSLADQHKAGTVLDLKLNYPSEWLTYAFSPIVKSAGGDLINREGYQSAQQKLNNKHAVAALTHLQTWMQQGWVDQNVDDAAFVSGRVSLSWAGHWEHQRYRETWGDDLVILPLPNFGLGMRTGQGSWQWGINKRSKTPQAAADFLNFLMSQDEVLAMSNANGAVPGTITAINHSKLYSEHGALRLFALQLLNGHAISRPQTAAYPVITSAFSRAMKDIIHGVDVQRALNTATLVIDRDIQDNEGYRSPETVAAP